MTHASRTWWPAALACMLAGAVALLMGAAPAGAAGPDTCVDDPPGGYKICLVGQAEVPGSIVYSYHSPPYCHLMYNTRTGGIIPPICIPSGCYCYDGVDFPIAWVDNGDTLRHQVDNRGGGTLNAAYCAFF